MQQLLIRGRAVRVFLWQYFFLNPTNKSLIVDNKRSLRLQQFSDRIARRKHTFTAITQDRATDSYLSGGS